MRQSVHPPSALASGVISLAFRHILLGWDQGVVFGSVVPFVYTVYGVNGYKRWATRNCEPRASAYRLL